MASLAEHLSGPPIKALPTVQVPVAADLAPIGLLCMSLTLVVVTWSVLAHFRVAPSRR